MTTTRLLALSVTAAAVAWAAEPANLLVNGGFEQRDPAGLATGWTGANPGSTEIEKGNRFASLARAKDGRQAELSQTVQLAAEVSHLAITGRMRGKDIASGEKPHERAQVFLTFLDAAGKPCGYGAVTGVAGTSTAWIQLGGLVQVPAKAKPAAVRVSVGLIGGATGSLEVDDLSVVANGQLPLVLDPAKPLELPAASWPTSDAAVKIDGEALTIVAAEARNVYAERWIRLPDGLTKLAIEAEMKGTGIQLGKEPSWQTPRIMVTFHDAAGAFLPPYGAVPELRTDTDDWKKMTVLREVPSGAHYIKLTPGLHHCAGNVSFRKIALSVPPVEPAKP